MALATKYLWRSVAKKTLVAVSLLVAFGVLSGCTGTKSSREKPKLTVQEKAQIEERKKKNIAERKAILASAVTVTVDGKVGVADERSYALVGPANGSAELTGALLERAATQVTGCAAEFQADILKFIPNFTKDTPFNTPSAARVNLSCP